MGNRLLLDISPTGVQHYADVEDDGNTLITLEHTPSSVEKEILDSNSRLRSLHQRSGSGLRHAARIPINTYNMWRDEWAEKYADKMTWQEFEVSKLNSRDFCNLRTGNKRGGSKKL